MNKALEAKLSQLPKGPGVYFHKNAAGETIYIGKAAVLRNRVRQYFQKSRYRDLKTDIMVAEIANVDWIEVDSEADALFLEAELVRRYLPPYNILLRDDKSLEFVRIDYKSAYPTVSTVRRPLDDKAEYFGPYLEGFAVRRALKLLRRAFPYATKKPVAQKRASLHYHLGLDPGLEEGKTSLEEYRANLRKLMRYLKGQKGQIIREIERDMKAAAKRQDFEKAAFYRNQLSTLKALEHQIIFSDRELLDASKDQALVQLAELLGLYGPEPKNTKVPQAADLDTVQGSVEQRTEAYKGYGKGSSADANEATRQNGHQSVSSANTSGGRLRSLRRIEGFDISHQQGSDNVASMVVFISGLPDKASYRKFKLRTPGNDDFAHMNEVITRRLRPENVKKWGLPDLALIDGGKGQLSAAIAARDGHAQTLPMIGLAKREEEIIISNRHWTLSESDKTKLMQKHKAFISQSSEDFTAILLPKSSVIVKLLQRLRDESHRFAVSYHSSLKRSRQTHSLIEDLPGIGPATRKKLIRHFGSLRSVSEAEVNDLAAVIGPAKARQVHSYLLKLKTKLKT